MATAITDSFVNAFEARVHHLGQQEMSRCLRTVRVKRENAHLFMFDRLANAAMAAKGTGVQATVVSGVVHSRRVAIATPFNWGEHLPQQDAARVLIDPRSEYAAAAGMAYGRQIDSIILAAANGTAATGVAGAGTQALPAGQKIGAAGALSLDNLRSAKRKLDEAEVMGERYLAINAKGLEDLLKVTEVASADYNTVKALVQGEINTFLGFNFIRTELLPIDAGLASRKQVIAYTSTAIGLGIPQDRMTRVAEDPANSFALRVYLETTLGAVRIEDEGVVQIDLAA